MSSSFLCPVFPFSRFLPQNPFILSKVQKLRTVQYVKKHVSQEYLWLLAIKHNIEPFAHTTGALPL